MPRETGECGERGHGQERCDERGGDELLRCAAVTSIEFRDLHDYEVPPSRIRREIVRRAGDDQNVAKCCERDSCRKPRDLPHVFFHAAIAFPEIEVGALPFDFPAALFNLGGHGSSRYWTEPVPDDEPGRLKAPRHPTHGNRARTESTKESCDAVSADDIRPVAAISLRRSRDCDGALRDCARRARIARCNPRPHAAPSDRRRRVRRAVFPNNRGAIRCRKQSDTTRRAARR